MKKFKDSKIFILILLSLTSLVIFSCVESIADTQTATTPTIEIVSPKTGDSIKVGNNWVSYKAAESTGGQGLSYYELYVNGTFTKRITQNTDGTNPNIFLTVDSTSLYSRISYYIIVYNKQGKQKSSKVQDNIYVRDKEPKAPSNLILSKVNDNEVLLHWDDNSGNENGFELWRKDAGTSTINYRRIATLPINTITTRDRGLSPFVSYSYKIRAYNTTGPSDYSNEVGTNTLPGGPWNLRAEAIGASAIRLRWVDFAPNEDGFLIERTDPVTNQFKVIALVDANTTEYFDNSVKANTGYIYRVAYFVKQSNSAYSNEVSVSTYYKDFSAPTNFTAIYLFNQGVQLEWTDNNKYLHQGTIIERKDAIGSNVFIEIGTAASDQTKFLDATIQRGQKYIYRARQILDKNTYTPYSTETVINVPN